MVVPITLLTLTASIWFGDLGEWLETWARPFQILCLKQTSHLDHLRAETQALVCGQKLSPKSELYSQLQTLGVIHLFVISGAHLLLFENLIEQLTKWTPRTRRILIPLSLIFFTLTSGASLPVLRALMARMIRSWGRRSFGALPAALLAGIGCLCLYPTSLKPLSLSLSWVAALAVQSKLQPLQKNILIYFLMLPLLLPLGAPHPLSILVNLVASIMLGTFLFPAFLIVFAFPSLEGFLFSIWGTIQIFMGELTSAMPLISVRSQLSNLWCLLYLTLIQFLFYFLHVRRRRAA